MRPLILVVNNEPEICALARQYLEVAGYSVSVASGQIMDFWFQKLHPSLIVVGMEVLTTGSISLPPQCLPDSPQERTPWVALFDKRSPQHRMIALDYGADKCIAKPFSAGDLVDCVQQVLHQGYVRCLPSNDKADIVIDSWAMKLLVRGLEVPATTLEFKLLEYLARHPGQVFTRNFLLDAVWGDLRYISPRSVDGCVRRIREKIEVDSAKPTMLKTVPRVGYRMDATIAWKSAPPEICDCSACRTRISALRLHESEVKRERRLRKDLVRSGTIRSKFQSLTG
jgi:DNA-binding response OmpR family regulator